MKKQEGNKTGGAQNKNGLKRSCLLIENILKYLLQQPGNQCIFQSQYGGEDMNGSGTSGTHRRQDDGVILPEFFPNPRGQKYDATKVRPMLAGNQQGAPESN